MREERAITPSITNKQKRIIKKSSTEKKLELKTLQENRRKKAKISREIKVKRRREELKKKVKTIANQDKIKKLSRINRTKRTFRGQMVRSNYQKN